MHIFKNNNFFNINYINTQNKSLKKNKSHQQIKSSSQPLDQKSSQEMSAVFSYQQSKQSKQNKSQKETYKKIIPGKNIVKNIDYGIFNKYRLDQFFNIQKNIDEGFILPIVSIQSHALHLEQKFVYFMQKFNQFQLTFIGAYGRRNSGKSLFLDKILNLATFEGSHFTQAKTQKNVKQIRLWTIPISRGKQKIFFVDCDGYSLQKDQQRQNEILCDFLMFLCSQIVLIEPLNDQRDNFISESYSILKNSMSRMILNKTITVKDCFYWPSNICLAYRSVQKVEHNLLKRLFLSVQQRKLGNIKDKRIQQNISDSQLKEILLTKYTDRKKIILNESYMYSVSQYVKSFYQNPYSKYYQQIKPNGNGLSTLLMNLVLSINCKQKININSIINKTKKQILAEAYNNAVVWLSKQLEKKLKGQQPKNSNQLLKIFDQIFFKTFQYFKKQCSTSLLIQINNIQLKTQIQEMQLKLQKYIREKQILILKINQKKTYKHLKQIIDKKIDIKQMPMQQILELRQILYKSRTIQRKLDVNRLQSLKQKMIQGWNKFIINQDIKQRDRIQKLQQQLQDKKYQLKKLTSNNYQIKLKATQTFQKYVNMNRQSTDLVSKVQNLKFQINIHKRSNKQKLQNSYQKIHIISKNQQQLLIQLKEYEQKLMNRNKVNTEQMKILREELEDAYKLETQEIKKMEIQNSNSVVKNNILSNNKQTNSKINSIYQFQFLNKQKIISVSNLPQLQQVSFFSRNEQQTPNALFTSRIARNTQSIRILCNQIDYKARTQQQLQQKLSSSYINLSRINFEYKNNKVRSMQSRKIKIQKG